MRRIITLLGLASVLCLLSVVALVAWPLPARTTPSLSPAVYSSEGVLLRAYLNEQDKWRFPVALAELPPFFAPGLLCLEDRRFFSHPGVDPLAMLRAAAQNLRAGKVVSGGSTITMQVARLLEPRRRTLRSKLVEVWRAVQLEWQLSKAEILTLYLTYAPYSSNVEGISAASYLYFGHGPASLTPAEAAFLYLLPQAPGRWEAYTPAQWQAARQRVLDRLAGCGVLTPQEVEPAQHAALPTARRYFPLLAAHFADYVRQHYGEPRQLTTSIAIDVQRLLERLAQRLQEPLAARGIITSPSSWWKMPHGLYVACLAILIILALPMGKVSRRLPCRARRARRSSPSSTPWPWTRALSCPRRCYSMCPRVLPPIRRRIFRVPMPGWLPPRPPWPSPSMCPLCICCTTWA